MPDIVGLRKEFENLLAEARAFFEEAAKERIQAIRDLSWDELSAEQQSRANGIRRRLRRLLAPLATAIQEAPLLDKRDLRRFAALGRGMDAALHFQPFRTIGRRTGDGFMYADSIFKDASEEITELLDLIPESNFSGGSSAPGEPTPLNAGNIADRLASMAPERRRPEVPTITSVSVTNSSTNG